MIWNRASKITSSGNITRRSLLVFLSHSVGCSCFSVPSAIAFAAARRPVPIFASRLYSSSSSNIMDSSSILQETADYNNCVSASVNVGNARVVEEDGGQMWLSLTRSVEDIDNDKTRSYEYTLPIIVTDDSNTKQPVFHNMPPTEVSSNIQAKIYSHQSCKLAILRADDNSNGNDGKTVPRQVFEIWLTTASSPSLVRRIPLPTNKLHGKVIVDSDTFGRPSWSPNDDKVLVYAAERKKPETVSFFDYQQPNQKTGDNDNNPIPGGQHTLGVGKSETWGEQLWKNEPLLDLFLLHTETGRVAKVTNVPGMDDNADSSLGSYTLGQVVFAPDGKSIVYTGWDAGGGQGMPKRLGLIYCIQRHSKLYASSISNLLEHISRQPTTDKDEDVVTDTDYVCLTPNNRMARSPRMSPEGKLVFLASKEGFDTHFGHLALHRMEWKNGAIDVSSEAVLVKQHWSIREQTEGSEGIVEQISFPGLALVGQLPEKCFVSQDTMVTNTIWGSSEQMVRINVNDGTTRLVRACIDGSDKWSKGLTSQRILCTTSSGGIVLKESTLNNPGVIAYIPPDELSKPNIVDEGAAATSVASLAPLSASTCAPVSATTDPVSDFTYQILNLEREGDDGTKWNAPIQSILVLPKQEEGAAKPPLICLPHGGPHSVSTTDYLPTWPFLCGLSKYALLLVNYRGSVGFGQSAVEDLPSRCSDLDVKDVVHAVKHVAESGLVDPARLGICGGSHGGFLTGHCIGQYPDLFKAACTRNPVTNIASMMSATDIPDWCVVEACGIGKYDWNRFTGASAEQLSEMYQKSPIFHSQKVKVPTLIALGMQDLRVPPFQGLEFYHILRSNGVKTKLLQYDDCDHPIGAVCSKADHWINIKRWFDEHM
ncbi:Acylamino-acid-releasing enzyme [Seminavis robusta]|uniref:Prolyl endopeptidase n=1 Tax=Seminavis robusta TaxID=568900 RepID=A0A9N8EE60_9STRA|nr:Acylamino-acid-releasing enzyme [Seminavis robusta]|eukprot:Sro809_g205520.1 Acylamino-acid-releasing enzyme (879) ;mRNA; f:4040-6795